MPAGTSAAAYKKIPDWLRIPPRIRATATKIYLPPNLPDREAGIARRIYRFYLLMATSVWALWYALAGPQPLAILESNWPVTLTMVFGSIIAGATSEGGGAIAFPVFTKALSIAPSDAKVFSLAIQSVGMSAATLMILYLRIPVERRVIFIAGLAGIPGIWLGAAWLAPLLPSVVIKWSFTLMVSSFAVTLLALNQGLRTIHERLPLHGHREHLILAMAGFTGGIVSGLIGNGIDIIVFSVMVLLFRVNEKVATPTSVILMASNSIAGFFLHAFVIGGFTPQVQQWWLAAVPVVVIGAPLGALICSRLDRHIIANVLIGLIAIELLTSVILLPISHTTAISGTLALLILSYMNYWMYRSKRYDTFSGEAVANE